MRKFNFSYDKEEDDLFLYYPKSKSSGSVEIGDLVLDYDSKKKLVGIQIANASDLLKTTTGGSASKIKKALTYLSKAMVNIKESGGFLVIWLYLYSTINEKIEDLAANLATIPNIKSPSPALMQT